MSDRAVPHVRKFLGQRLRELRKQRRLSQERLGNGSSLSGKFIGEVGRGEKSISIDSLYKVSVALAVPLSSLTDVRPGKRAVVPSKEAEQILALVSARHRPADVATGPRDAPDDAQEGVGAQGARDGSAGIADHVWSAEEIARLAE
jgi:transcriptional regulator with XRE-family HTH domain